MIQVRFKNLKESKMVKELAEMRISDALERFPGARVRIAVITFEMDNSPSQPGVDSFKARLEIIGGRYHGVILEKSSEDLYKALYYVCDGLLERLNRYSDRIRTKSLREQRRFATFRRRVAFDRAQGE